MEAVFLSFLFVRDVHYQVGEVAINSRCFYAGCFVDLMMTWMRKILVISNGVMDKRLGQRAY
jgi:hypothetical protein